MHHTHAPHAHHHRNKFPNRHFFKTDKLLDFFVTLGLKSKMTPETIVECATELAKSAFSSPTPFAPSEDWDRDFSASVKLTDYIWSHFTELSSPFFWEQISAIPFVPVSFKGRKCFKRYNEVSPWDHRSKTWTVLPVLSEAHSPPSNFHGRLGIMSPTSPVIVLQHIQNITTTTFDRWQSLFENDEFPVISPVDVFTDIFHYLKENWSDIPAEAQNRLKKTRLVPVGDALLMPCRLYFRLDSDLAPFLYETPR